MLAFSREESKSTTSRLFFGLYLFSIASCLCVITYQSCNEPPAKPVSPAPATIDPTRQELTVQLTRGDFTVLRFPSKKPATKAIILFGSGDGGWRSDFEERVCRGLQAQGYELIGIDCAVYAQTDYDLPTLQADYTRIAEAAEASFGARPPPLIVGGYSMGAEQVVAVAGGPNPPPGIAGLLIISPISRGRYGLRTLDQMDVPPSGPGTFALADFAPKLGAMRVVQWHGGWDPTDSLAWLDRVRVPHQALVYPNAWHDFKAACPDFLEKLGDSVEWVISPNVPPPSTAISHATQVNRTN
jgi:hypothetical protein